MPADISKRLHHLDELDMPKDQKILFLEALWVFSERIMDLICGTEATQLALGLPPAKSSNSPDDPLDSSHTIQQDFSTAAEEDPARKDIP